MTQRQRLRLLLSDLLHARLAAKLAKGEYAADARPETSDRYERAKQAALHLETEAQRLIVRAGTAKDKARLAALLSIRWLWLLAVGLPV
jgi:hypothetical protein